MDKEKQIEDLTAIIDSFNIKTYENAKSVSKFLIEKYGYRKINENEVVISKEELEDVLKYLEEYHKIQQNFPKQINAMVEMYNKGYEQASKETAREILKTVYKAFEEKTDADSVSSVLDEIAEKYGVDLGDNNGK